MSLSLLLLPGLDGTGQLFKPFIAALSARIHPEVVCYPADTVTSQPELESHIRLPSTPFAIVGESYSGPMALRLAARRPANLRAVILVAGFLKNPISFVSARLRPLVQARLFRLGTPDLAIRALLLGSDAPRDLVRDFQTNLQGVAPAVLAARVREVLEMDAEDHLRRCAVPLLYLAGTRDRLVSLRHAREMKRVRPELVIEKLNAPHLVLQRCPGESAAAIERFLC